MDRNMVAWNTGEPGEFGLIRWIREQVGASDSLVQGIGDDCAIEELDHGEQLLTSTDLLIEDVHFKRNWTSMFDLGRKSVAVNISDIAAMGGTPQSLYLGIGRPKQVTVTEIKDFIRGFLSEAGLFKVVLAGGDTCASPGPLMIAVTAHGRVAKSAAVCRRGARIGDAIYVSGTLGDSALALQKLLSGKQPESALAQRLHTPTARVALGQQLVKRRLATAMLDVSDGLLADLNHLLVASEVGAELELGAIPLSGAFRKALRQDPKLIDLALAGGEDYELLFTSAVPDLDRQTDFNPAVKRIGTICQTPDLRIRQADGSDYQCNQQGFDHFAPA